MAEGRIAKTSARRQGPRIMRRNMVLAISISNGIALWAACLSASAASKVIGNVGSCGCIRIAPWMILFAVSVSYMLESSCRSFAEATIPALISRSATPVFTSLAFLTRNCSKSWAVAVGTDLLDAMQKVAHCRKALSYFAHVLLLSAARVRVPTSPTGRLSFVYFWAILLLLDLALVLLFRG